MIDGDGKDYSQMTMQELFEEKHRIIKCLTLAVQMNDVWFSQECDKELHMILKEIKKRGKKK